MWDDTVVGYLGRDTSEADLGYLGKIERRHQYLEANWKLILVSLKWPIPLQAPRVVSFYVAQRAYWWTKFPPRSTDVVFVRIEMLNDAIKRLIQ
jgi:hypothetical protein